MTRKITVRFGRHCLALVLELRSDTVGTGSLFFQRKEPWNLKTVKISTHGRIAISFHIDILNKNTNWETFFKRLKGALSHEACCRFQENPAPILINCYKRNYFINRDHTIRITIDTGLKIFDQRYSSSPNLNRKAILPSSGHF